MADESVILAWSKCEVLIGKTGASDAEATELKSVGLIADKTTQVTSNDGESLDMYSTGHELVDSEKTDGTLQLVTTVIEPTSELYTALGLGTADEQGNIQVKTLTPADKFTVKVVPKNVGAYGIVAPKCSVSAQETYGEDKGNQMVLTFTILKTASGWYKKVKKTQASS